jgi:hypothetical protein
VAQALPSDGVRKLVKLALETGPPVHQGSFFWLQNREGEPVVGVFATNHQPQVLPPYFAARKKNPAVHSLRVRQLISKARSAQKPG